MIVENSHNCGYKFLSLINPQFEIFDKAKNVPQIIRIEHMEPNVPRSKPLTSRAVCIVIRVKSSYSSRNIKQL